MTRHDAKQLWKEKFLNDADTINALKEETWYGVAVGFFIGCGFDLSEAVILATEVDL